MNRGCTLQPHRPRSRPLPSLGGGATFAFPAHVSTDREVDMTHHQNIDSMEAAA